MKFSVNVKTDEEPSPQLPAIAAKYSKLALLGIPIILKVGFDIIKTQLTGKSTIHAKTNIYRRRSKH